MFHYNRCSRLLRLEVFPMRRSLVLFTALLIGLNAPASAKPQPADTVLHHGTILTVDARDRVVQALASLSSDPPAGTAGRRR